MRPQTTLRVVRVGLAALLAAGALALTARAAEPEPPELRVFAAASMTEVVNALAERFEGTAVRASFGASSELARQIADGAPADIFLAASPEWIDFLREKQALAGEAAVFAGNELVAVAPVRQRAGGARRLARRPVHADVRDLARPRGEMRLEGIPARERAPRDRVVLHVADAALVLALGARPVGRTRARAEAPVRCEGEEALVEAHLALSAS